MKQLPTTLGKRARLRPLSLALLDDAKRLLLFVIDVILLAVCAAALPVLLFRGTCG
jgi:hypothetical protein